MASLHISLSETMRSFVEKQVDSGAYHNQSEYVRDLIRHDQERRARQQVDALLAEGLDSGEPRALTDDDWEAIRTEARKRVEARSGSEE